MANQPSPDPLLLGRSVSIDQAVQLLGVAKRTIYYWIVTGKLQTIYVRESQRVLVESIVAVQQTRRAKPERRGRPRG